MQKHLPGAPEYGHSYVALVDDSGEITQEFHGTFSAAFTLGTRSGNMLNAVDEPIFNNEANVEMGNGSMMKIVAAGSDDRMVDLWERGKEAVKKEIDEKQFLYRGTSFDPFEYGVNSNSVWYTFLKAIGVERPQQFNGPLHTPGAPNDLRELPSNNPALRRRGEVDMERDSDTAAADEDLRTTVLLAKSPSDWRETDAEHVAESRAHADRNHPEHDAAVHAVGKYRDRHRSGLRTGDSGGPVHVDGYDRQQDGHSVHVDEYWRGRPRG